MCIFRIYVFWRFKFIPLIYAAPQQLNQSEMTLVCFIEVQHCYASWYVNYWPPKTEQILTNASDFWSFWNRVVVGW
jgi:hypothetical protein